MRLCRIELWPPLSASRLCAASSPLLTCGICASSAAGLTVFSAHSSIKNDNTRIEKADIVLSTAGSQIPDILRAKPIHRLMIDESHLLGRECTTSFKLLFGYHARNIWLVTATPLSRSVDDLKTTAVLLGHTGKCLGGHGHGQDLVRLDNNAMLVKHTMVDGLGDALVSKLRRLMIRHTKSQRIGGELALALPESDTCTIWLDFSAEESRLYDLSVKHEASKTARLNQAGATAMALEMALAKRRAACGNAYCKNTDGKSFFHTGGPFSEEQVKSMCTSVEQQFGTTFSLALGKIAPRYISIYTSRPDKCTKLAALRRDLLQLRQQDASMHAVVFTHLVVSHRNIVAMLKDAGFVVCEFSGTTAADKRHDAIRDFQESGQKQNGVAKVFVVTIKTGSVGITLTAASRVYLMEPCFDPGEQGAPVCVSVEWDVRAAMRVVPTRSFRAPQRRRSKRRDAFIGWVKRRTCSSSALLSATRSRTTSSNSMPRSRRAQSRSPMGTFPQPACAS